MNNRDNYKVNISACLFLCLFYGLCWLLLFCGLGFGLVDILPFVGVIGFGVMNFLSLSHSRGGLTLFSAYLCLLFPLILTILLLQLLILNFEHHQIIRNIFNPLNILNLLQFITD